jgi:hypothetical protein
MATGRSNELTKQLGEYLVAAELCRRGFITATFAGSVPDFDIVAIGPDGDHRSIQVKASRSENWHLDAGRFVNITMDGQRQVLGQKTKEPSPGLICVFVVVDTYGHDRFFIIKWRELQTIVVSNYREKRRQQNWVRPRAPTSRHTALKVSSISQNENQWAVIASPL